MLSITPYREVLSDYEKAIAWVSSFTKLGPGSRLTQYLKDLNKIVQLREGPLLNEKEQDVEKLKNSVFEATEIIKIHKLLFDFLGAGLKERLNDVADGPERYPAEKALNSSSRSRNIAFELYMAGEFHRAGFNIDLSHHRADFTFPFENRVIYAECKRPQRSENIFSCVKEAYNQLLQHYRNSAENSNGIILISLNKILNPDLNEIFVNSEEEATSRLRTLLSEEALKTKNEIQGILKRDNRTLGVMGVLSHPTIIAPMNMYTYSVDRYFQSANIFGSHKEEKIAEMLISKLRNGLINP